MKRLLIQGSTGSIGRQTLDVVRKHGDRFCVFGLVAHSNTDLLLAQVEEFAPRIIGITDPQAFDRVSTFLPKNALLFRGQDALTQTPLAPEVDVVVCAVVGMAGIHGVLAANKAGKRIALANKEALVAGGRFVSTERVFPIDSEHSAIRECLASSRGGDVARLVLTASGGPFYGMSRDQLGRVTVDDALRHPTWSMGKKITIDSATMANKALEIIEARWLYNCRNIEYVVHRQSIIHSMVEFVDGSVIAQLCPPDMRLPIQLAISEERLPRTACPLVGMSLTLEAPDEATFTPPAIAKRLVEVDSLGSVAFNSANEAAVALFLEGRLGFVEIMDIAEEYATEYISTVDFTLDDVFALDREIRAKINQKYSKKIGN